MNTRDPLDALREPIVAVAPDAVFAARLRARLEIAVLNPKGTEMSSTPESAAPRAVVLEETPPVAGDVVYASLWVPDVERAAAFYEAVLGWRTRPGSGPRSRQVEDATPPIGMSGDAPDSPHSTLFLVHAVADLPAAVARVRAAGGTADEPEHRPYGYLADCVDNQGMRFALMEQSAAERAQRPPTVQGSLLYLTVSVPNSAQFRDFYGSLFGWTFTPGRIEDGWRVTEPRPMAGMHGGEDRCAISPMYGVTDIGAAVARVRAAGGTATDPTRMPYGTTADCVDDQGFEFYLGQL